MRKALGLVAVGMLTALVAVYAEQTPTKATLDDCGEKQASVVFDHEAHVKLAADCTKCHHEAKGLTAANAATTEVKACSECHVKPEAATTPGCADMSMTKNIFHITCVTCHKEAVKADATKKAPTKCTECHPKG